MIIVKASAESEAGVMPSTELLTAMGNFNEELVRAGVLKAGDGLHPTSNSVRIVYQGGEKSVVQGPFHEPNITSGFWIIEVPTRQDAIDWMMKAPNPYPGDGNIEIRQIFTAEDFGEAATPEVLDQQARLRAQSAV